MTDKTRSESLRFLDVFAKDDFIRIVAIAGTDLIVGHVMPNKRNAVMAAIDSGANVAETIGLNAKSFWVVPISTIRSVEWHTDIGIHFVYHLQGSPQTLVCTEVTFSTKESQARFEDLIRECFGDYEFSEERASIWHAGANPITGGAVFFCVCVGLAIAMHYQKETTSSSGELSFGRRARNREMAEMLENVGPTGMILIGLGILAVMGIWWWYIVRFKRPTKFAIARVADKP